jgi:hypothetical protein
MRTTLDIDDDVLKIAKDMARVRKESAGRVISDLLREAMTRPSSVRDFEIVDGIPLLKGTGAVVTPELVERLLNDADLEDAGLEAADG